MRILLQWRGKWCEMHNLFEEEGLKEVVEVMQRSEEPTKGALLKAITYTVNCLPSKVTLDIHEAEKFLNG